MSCLSTWSTAGGAVLEGCGTFQRQGLEEVGHWGRALRPASQSPSSSLLFPVGIQCEQRSRSCPKLEGRINSSPTGFLLRHLVTTIGKVTTQILQESTIN